MVVGPLGDMVNTESEDGDRGTARPGEGGVEMGGGSSVENVVCLLEGEEREGEGGSRRGRGRGRGREQEREWEGAGEGEGGSRRGGTKGNVSNAGRPHREPTVS